ncbi:MAG: phage tail terminator-like protein [Agrobacterium cavarae]
MPVGVEANIFRALIEHLLNLTFTPALLIAAPNVVFPPIGQSKPRDFLEVTYLPNSTTTRTVGEGRQMHRGIMQVTVHYSSGTGIIKPMEIADRIIAHFPLGLVLYESGIRVKIYRKPYQTPLPPESGSLLVPVTIQYESFNV